MCSGSLVFAVNILQNSGASTSDFTVLEETSVLHAHCCCLSLSAVKELLKRELLLGMFRWRCILSQ